MRVDFYGTVRQIAGEKTVEFEFCRGLLLHELLRGVVERFPGLEAEMFDKEGNLYASIPIFINGRNPRLLKEGMDTAVQPGDVLSIFSPISSGRINVEDANRSLTGSIRAKKRLR